MAFYYSRRGEKVSRQDQRTIGAAGEGKANWSVA